MLEKRANFREATKNLLVFTAEEKEMKKEKSRSRKVGYILNLLNVVTLRNRVIFPYSYRNTSGSFGERVEISPLSQSYIYI